MDVLSERIWLFMQAPPPEERIFHLRELRRLAPSDQALQARRTLTAPSPRRSADRHAEPVTLYGLLVQEDSRRRGARRWCGVS